MKKILIILSALSINAIGQTTHISIVDQSPNIALSSVANTLNVGDSAYIGVDWTLNTNDSFLVHILGYGQINNTTNRIPINIYKVSYVAYNTPIYIYANNGGINYQAHKIKLTIPSAPAGHYHLRLFGYGNCATSCSTIPNCGSGEADFYLANPNSIEQYSNPDRQTSTKYFNLLGQPIEKPEGITVEIKIFQDGRREIRKIITY